MDNQQLEQARSTTEVEEYITMEVMSRRNVGRKKYGKTMERDDLSRIQWMQHAKEEALDLAIYLERCIREEIKLEEFKLKMYGGASFNTSVIHKDLQPKKESLHIDPTLK